MPERIGLDGQWLTGRVTCWICDHEWVAVVEVGTDLTSLECPNCHAPQGHIDPVKLADRSN